MQHFKSKSFSVRQTNDRLSSNNYFWDKKCHNSSFIKISILKQIFKNQ